MLLISVKQAVLRCGLHPEARLAGNRVFAKGLGELDLRSLELLQTGVVIIVLMEVHVGRTWL